MNSTATYTEPVNRIKQRILFDDNFSKRCLRLCENWSEFTYQEIEEWGIYKLGGVDFDTLTESRYIEKVRSVYGKSENGYIREEV